MNFTAAKLIAAERYLGKSIGEIIEEAKAENGMSMHTLRALMAASNYYVSVPMDLPPTESHVFHVLLGQAGEAIDKRGAAACGEEVGKALGAFVRKHFASGEAA